MKVIKNWGKMEPMEVDVPPVVMPSILEGQPDVVMSPGFKTVVQSTPAGKLWHDVARGIPQRQDQWFIAVQDGDGFIACCERDPSMVSLNGYDIIQIETYLTRDQIFCQKWIGDDVEPWPPMEEQMRMLAAPDYEERLAALEARVAALESEK